jgi:hypothetical protein
VVNLLWSLGVLPPRIELLRLASVGDLRSDCWLEPVGLADHVRPVRFLDRRLEVQIWPSVAWDLRCHEQRQSNPISRTGPRLGGQGHGGPASKARR